MSLKLRVAAAKRDGYFSYLRAELLLRCGLDCVIISAAPPSYICLFATDFFFNGGTYCIQGGLLFLSEIRVYNLYYYSCEIRSQKATV